MNNIIIKGQTTKEEAMKGNKVSMAGTIKNKNQVMREQAIVKETTVEQAIVKEATTDIVAEACEIEIPAFLIKVQEERRVQKIINAQKRANKKKAPTKKPSIKNAIISILKQI